MDKDTLILLVRIGLKSAGDSADAVIKETKKVFNDIALQGNVTIFYLTSFDTDDSNIECINPKLVTADSYKEAEAKLKLLNEELDKLLKTE
jgi:hypothetical protein